LEKRGFGETNFNGSRLTVSGCVEPSAAQAVALRQERRVLGKRGYSGKGGAVSMLSIFAVGRYRKAGR